MSQRCTTCSYWDGLPSSTSGGCHHGKLRGQQHPDAANLEPDTDGLTFDANKTVCVLPLTGPQFGCVHHAAKS